MGNTPNVRFKGFTEDWEQRKLGEISQITAGGTPSTKELTYWKPKEVPWLASGEVHKKYIYDTDEMISEEGLNNSSAKWVEEGSVLIALAGQGKTRGTAAITRIPITTNQSIAAIKFNDILDADYAFHNLDSRYDELRNISSGDGTRGGLNKQLLADLTITFPQICEQRAIGEYFTNLDHLITLHQQKCDETKEFKKYMLQNMFPQKDEKVPKIRFDGFTEDWEQRKLGELYQRNTERNENLIGYDKTISVATMSYKDDGNGASESSLSTYKVLRVGDIAFEGHTNKQFRFGRFVVNDIGTGIMSPRFSTLRPLNEMPVNFWKQYIHSESVMRRILVNSTKAGTMMNELVIPEFLNQTIMVPSENEQAVIGQYFTNLDHIITLHQQKCNALKKFKKYMLQNMFPQKGENKCQN